MHHFLFLPAALGCSTSHWNNAEESLYFLDFTCRSCLKTASEIIGFIEEEWFRGGVCSTEVLDWAGQDETKMTNWSRLLNLRHMHRPWIHFTYDHNCEAHSATMRNDMTGVYSLRLKNICKTVQPVIVKYFLDKWKEAKEIHCQLSIGNQILL